MRFTFGKKHICTYCGEPADTIDHTIPYSWFRDTNNRGQRRSESIGFMTYACRECNCILGNRIFPTFQDRCRFVKNKLQKRYRDKMGVIWDEDELSELSGGLRAEIERSNRLNLRLRERISWQDSQDFQDIMFEAMDRLYFDENIDKKQKEFLLDTDYIPECLR